MADALVMFDHRYARAYYFLDQALAAPRPELSKYAPRIVSLKIDPEKIGALVGPGGKNIKRIVEDSGCEIKIEDDGSVKIYSVSAEGMQIAREAIERMTQIAPVDVLIVKGNHDEERIFYFGDTLESWFYRNPNVTVDNRPMGGNITRSAIHCWDLLMDTTRG